MTRANAVWTVMAVAVALLAVTGLEAQTVLLELENATEDTVLKVQDDAGFVALGTFNSGTIPATGAGVRMMWFPTRAGFRAGRVGGTQWDLTDLGYYSVGMGYNVTASSAGAVAMGQSTTASGDGAFAAGISSEATMLTSIALGHTAHAYGDYSFAAGSGVTTLGSGATAIGLNAEANGDVSVALGNGVAGGNYSLAVGNAAEASAPFSIALGTAVSAGGSYSVALGHRASTGSHQGAFVYGDRSTTADSITATADHEFAVRAAGGFRFRTTADLSTGCNLPYNSGSWECSSSRDLKEGFQPVDAEAVLRGVAGLPILRYRFRGADPSVWHMGPMAEDFWAAFGLGHGDKAISTVDLDGVSLAAIQALEARTRDLEALRAEVAELRAANAELRERLDRLVALLEAGR